MNELEHMFPSLALFSDIDWEAVTKEYETDYIDVSFPEYLQEKALDGDCPPYLFELAYYELALFDAKASAEPFPFKPGIYLNPTALFLSLEFDVKKMLEQAKTGQIEILERTNVLCLFKDTHDKIHTTEMSDEELDILQHLEDGPKEDRSFVTAGNMSHFEKFIQTGLVIDLK
jgi:hypothetical protein